VNEMATKPAPVRRSVHVNVPPAKAFQVFTAGMSRWWLPMYKIGATAFTDIVVEPGVGGRWFERGSDGIESQWGKVLVWEPPARLVLAWQVDGAWKFDAELLTEVEILFSVEGDGTRVELEHRNLDRFASHVDAMAAAVNRGWPALLEAYAQTA
jgi:uncharacterized protein YndB with AHSA1/START domain